VNINGKLTSNHPETVDTFNKYFLSAAETTDSKNNDSSINKIKKKLPIHHLLQSCENPFLNIKPKSLAPGEVKR
jgi:hypothetical protein